MTLHVCVDSGHWLTNVRISREAGASIIHTTAAPPPIHGELTPPADRPDGCRSSTFLSSGPKPSPHSLLLISLFFEFPQLSCDLSLSPLAGISAWFLSPKASSLDLRSGEGSPPVARAFCGGRTHRRDGARWGEHWRYASSGLPAPTLSCVIWAWFLFLFLESKGL